MKGRLVILLSLFVSLFVWANEPGKVYVRSEKAQLLDSPRFGAKSIAQLKRGDALQVLDQQGSWYKVRGAAQAEGWISSAFVAQESVKTQAGLAKSESEDPRAARRRGARAATMGVRGLTRGADKLDDAQADHKTLQEVENDAVPQGDVKQYEQDLKKDQ